jgi:hypothetical protein
VTGKSRLMNANEFVEAVADVGMAIACVVMTEKKL